MSLLPKLFSLPVLVVIVWLGSNVYYGNDLFANPFEEQQILEKIKERGSELIEDKVEEATDAAKDSFKQGVDDASDRIKDAADDV